MIRVDEGEIRSHVDEVVHGSVEGRSTDYWTPKRTILARSSGTSGVLIESTPVLGTTHGSFRRRWARSS